MTFTLERLCYAIPLMIAGRAAIIRSGNSHVALLGKSTHAVWFSSFVRTSTDVQARWLCWPVFIPIRLQLAGFVAACSSKRLTELWIDCRRTWQRVHSPYRNSGSTAPPASSGNFQSPHCGNRSHSDFVRAQGCKTCPDRKPQLNARHVARLLAVRWKGGLPQCLRRCHTR